MEIDRLSPIPVEIAHLDHLVSKFNDEVQSRLKEIDPEGNMDVLQLIQLWAIFAHHVDPSEAYRFATYLWYSTNLGA